MVAIHRGVRAIESGECEMAIVGGVNTLVSPELHISASKAWYSPPGTKRDCTSKCGNYWPGCNWKGRTRDLWGKPRIGARHGPYRIWPTHCKWDGRQWRNG
ncbi:MAG: hypothetical protein E6J34_10955 [Chloroflexi bacterium]|nr:MAG: hypothetical protein E6J34_10955 [Chloroflexota bacterium]